MRNISDIDHNFSVAFHDSGLDYFDVFGSPELIYGLIVQNDSFCRIPKETARQINGQVEVFSAVTSGGRMRFRTDSRTVALQFSFAETFTSSNLSTLASCGFDLYERLGECWQFRGCFLPPDDLSVTQNGTLQLPSTGMHELLIHFPLYAEIKSLALGLQSGSSFFPFPYSNGSFVIYGSSITQGGCASRPGNCFSSIVSRRLDMDYVNLGFSSGARGEPAMAEYLCERPCDILVLDYDHNAPNAEYLAKTYEPFFRMIRERRPTLPIVLMSAPVAHIELGEWKQRRDIIHKTYRYAIDRGDDKVWFLDGSMVFSNAFREECMVDQWHPADIGMTGIADALCGLMKKILA